MTNQIRREVPGRKILLHPFRFRYQIHFPSSRISYGCSISDSCYSQDDQLYLRLPWSNETTIDQRFRRCFTLISSRYRYVFSPFLFVFSDQIADCGSCRQSDPMELVNRRSSNYLRERRYRMKVELRSTRICESLTSPNTRSLTLSSISRRRRWVTFNGDTKKDTIRSRVPRRRVV